MHSEEQWLPSHNYAINNTVSSGGLFVKIEVGCAYIVKCIAQSCKSYVNNFLRWYTDIRASDVSEKIDADCVLRSEFIVGCCNTVCAWDFMQQEALCQEVIGVRLHCSLFALLCLRCISWLSEPQNHMLRFYNLYQSCFSKGAEFMPYSPCNELTQWSHLYLLLAERKLKLFAKWTDLIFRVR